MFTLPILQDELRVELPAPFKGVVAVVRPFDVIEGSKWADTFRGQIGTNLARATAIKDQLIRIEGLVMEEPGGAKVPYDHSNPKHWASLPQKMFAPIYDALLARATVSDDAEKKSESPSASDGTGSMESSPAESAVSEPETK